MDFSYCRSSQVVLFGFSAGAIGTEANCDMVADTLHAINPDIKVTRGTSVPILKEYSLCVDNCAH